MSKFTEALEKVRVLKKTSASPTPQFSKTFEKRPASHQMTQQDLADVYFSGSGKAKIAAAPTVIRVVDRRRSYLLPWVITTVALVLASLALFTTKRVSINVNFEGDPASLSAATPQRMTNSGSFARVMRLSPMDFTLSATAMDGSKTKEVLSISNRGVNGASYAAIELNPTFNATGYALEFEAKGHLGGEELEVIFRDIRRQSSLNSAPLRPFPMGLTPRWEVARVIIDKMDSFDATRIAHLRFEVGTQRTSNPPDSLVSIRNVRWVPRS